MQLSGLILSFHSKVQGLSVCTKKVLLFRLPSITVSKGCNLKMYMTEYIPQLVKLGWCDCFP